MIQQPSNPLIHSREDVLRRSQSRLPVGGEVYHVRDLCLTNPASKTSRWSVTITRERDGLDVASYMVLSTATRTGYRLNCPGFTAWASWQDCYAALLVDAVRRNRVQALTLADGLGNTHQIAYTTTGGAA